MSHRCIVTYAEGAHQELLDVVLPGFKDFAARYNYDLIVGKQLLPDLPPAWQKVPLLIEALRNHSEVVWFDCDLVIVDPSEDFPPMGERTLHSLVRHFEECSEVPNSGVWRIRQQMNGLRGTDLLTQMLQLQVFRNHGWWEQAALMILMGYIVPPEGSRFLDTKCRCIQKTKWYDACEFMRLCWNSHPNYRAEHPRIVHCSYPDMPRRLEIMRTLVRDPHYDYPKFVPDEDKE